MSQPQPHALRVEACAKLNLALSVGPLQGPRGYHPIASWFVGIALADTLELTRLGDGGASRYEIRWADGRDAGPIALRPSAIDWPVEKDLAVRAHRLLEQRAGRALPVGMRLIKRTPVGGGLGGGSADAAAMLRGINALFALGLTQGQLVEISMQLGSDIAFFLDERDGARVGADGHWGDDPPEPCGPRPALVTGFGEVIQRVASPAVMDVLLLLPPFGCPTGAVYTAFDAAPTRRVDEERVRALIDSARPGRAWSPASLFNDLARPASVVEPRIAGMLERLGGSGGLGPSTVHVTGSGSTMFVIPEAGMSTAELAARAEALVPELVVVATTTL